MPSDCSALQLLAMCLMEVFRVVGKSPAEHNNLSPPKLLFLHPEPKPDTLNKCQTNPPRYPQGVSST